MTENKEDTIEFAEMQDDVLVIKVRCRGTFKNSIAIKQLYDQIIKGGKKPKVIVDLAECPSMDSTFMGTLAGMGKNQMQTGQGKLKVVNLNPQTDRLLQTLGLNYILDAKITPPEKKAELENKFIKQEISDIEKVEQISHMLEAHMKLVDIDSSNEARFQSVLHYLKSSLEKEKLKKGGDSTENNED